MQGDIIAIVNGNKLVAEYEYDAWGNCTILRNTNNIANTNPLRYRGYYLDTDTNLYYLQSRYYDANIGRFINADDAELLGMSGGVVSNNLFAYCDNNPIMYIDINGESAIVIGAVCGGTVAVPGIGWAIAGVCAAAVGIYAAYSLSSNLSFSSGGSTTKVTPKAKPKTNKKTNTVKKATIKKVTVKKSAISKVLDKISNKIKTPDKKRVDLSKFKTKLKKGDRKGPGKWTISPDKSDMEVASGNY